MLKNMTNGALIIQCNNCKKINALPLQKKIHKFVEGEFENYYTEPRECGAIEIFNLNIPTDDMEEFELEQNIMPYYDIDQRYYLRELIKLVREDFQNLSE